MWRSLDRLHSNLSRFGRPINPDRLLGLLFPRVPTGQSTFLTCCKPCLPAAYLYSTILKLSSLRKNRWHRSILIQDRCWLILEKLLHDLCTHVMSASNSKLLRESDCTGRDLLASNFARTDGRLEARNSLFMCSRLIGTENSNASYSKRLLHTFFRNELSFIRSASQCNTKSCCTLLTNTAT